MIKSLINMHKRKPPWFTVTFDSSSGLVNALANCLDGKGFPGVGTMPESEWLAKGINMLPWKIKRNIYVKGSAKGSVDSKKMGKVDVRAFSEWVCGMYPKQNYSSIFIGSSNGAAINICAALGVPWFPQTFLIPVSTPGKLGVDEPMVRMEWARPYGEALLAANPHLQLNHMMDPNQDRPVLGSTSYFRVKQLLLDDHYKKFMLQNLEENATIYIVDCRKSWPVTKVDERHYFQFGGLGGNTIEEYQNGSKRIEDYLKQEGSKFTKWITPPVDKLMPEAEWGFEDFMGQDIIQFAKEHGFKVKRIVFNEPEDLSPFTADLYKWWYKQLERPVDKLLVEMFFLMEPYLAISTGAIPFWLAFNAESSLQALAKYLKSTGQFDEIYMMLFSHGVKGMGLATIEQWQKVLSSARNKTALLGCEPEKYPFDFGMYARYEKDLLRRIPNRFSTDVKLSPQQLQSFYKADEDRYDVEWIDEV